MRKRGLALIKNTRISYGAFLATFDTESKERAGGVHTTSDVDAEMADRTRKQFGTLPWALPIRPAIAPGASET